MRNVLSLFFVVFGVLSLSPLKLVFTDMPKAFAVVGDTKQSVEQSTSKAVIKRIDLPVHYQITKARIMGAEATTETENYREAWILEIRSGGIAYLQSPRHSVPVYLPKLAKDAGSPAKMILLEKDFAALLGIKFVANEEESEIEEQKGHMITMRLDRRGDGTSYNVNISEEERLVVHLEVGTTTSL